MKSIRKDSGVSDVVGSALMLGVTVSLVLVASMSIQDAVHEAPGPVDTEYRVEPSADGEALVLLHLGGRAWSTDDLRVFVAARAESAMLVPHGPDSWGPGDRLRVDLPTSLAIGPADHAEVLVHSASTGAMLPPVGLMLPRVVAVGGPAGDATMTLTFVGPDSAFASTSVRLLATVDHPRQMVESVTVDLRSIGQAWSHPMWDDGTHGDAVAYDGVFSADIAIPHTAKEAWHTLQVTARLRDAAALVETIDLFVKTFASDSPHVDTPTIDKAWWTLSKTEGKKLHVQFHAMSDDPIEFTVVELRHRPFQPGQTGIVALNFQCAQDGKVTSSREFSVNHYDPALHSLEYYLLVGWKEDGEVKMGSITPQPPSQYFTLQHTEVSKSVAFNGTGTACG